MTCEYKILKWSLLHSLNFGIQSDPVNIHIKLNAVQHLHNPLFVDGKLLWMLDTSESNVWSETSMLACRP